MRVVRKNNLQKVVGSRDIHIPSPFDFVDTLDNFFKPKAFTKGLYARLKECRAKLV